MEIRTLEEAMEAVKRHGMLLQNVPEELLTEDVCMAAVRQCGLALKYVPSGLDTADVCRAAVGQDGAALAFVPRALKTPKLCLEAVRQEGAALAWVPEELKTADMCLEAVRQNGCLLNDVPDEMRTAEVCMAAVRQNALAEAWVPERLKEKLRRLMEDEEREESMPPAGTDEAFMDAACRAFAKFSADYAPLPAECPIRLEMKRRDGGFLCIGVSVSDPDGVLYGSGREPCVRAAYLSEGGQGAPDPAGCLRRFADRLEDGPAEDMPPKMRAFCAHAVRRAAEACAQEDEEEGASLRP